MSNNETELKVKKNQQNDISELVPLCFSLAFTKSVPLLPYHYYWFLNRLLFTDNGNSNTPVVESLFNKVAGLKVGIVKKKKNPTNPSTKFESNILRQCTELISCLIS